MSRLRREVVKLDAARKRLRGGRSPAQPEDRTPHGVPGFCGHCAFWSSDPEAVRAHRETCSWREQFFASGGRQAPYGG